MRPEGDTWGPFLFAEIRGEKCGGGSNTNFTAAESFCPLISAKASMIFNRPEGLSLIA